MSCGRVHIGWLLLFETGSCSVAWDDLEFKILLAQLPEHWRHGVCYHIGFMWAVCDVRYGVWDSVSFIEWGVIKLQLSFLLDKALETEPSLKLSFIYLIKD